MTNYNWNEYFNAVKGPRKTIERCYRLIKWHVTDIAYTIVMIAWLTLLTLTLCMVGKDGSALWYVYSVGMSFAMGFVARRLKLHADNMINIKLSIANRLVYEAKQEYLRG